MKEKWQHRWLKLIAGLLLIPFISSQTLGAEPPVSFSENKIYVAERAAGEISTDSEAVLPQSTLDFLSDARPLQSILPEKQEGEAVETGRGDPPEENPGNLRPESFSAEQNNYEFERYDFEEALEVFRSEYAAAVILRDLSEADLKKLTDLGFETGILVLHGEMVLFSSGSPEELGVLPAVKELTAKAALISHTHPGDFAKQGPSGADLNEAVDAPGAEYVVTREGVFAYNRDGILNGGNAYSFGEYLGKISRAVEESRLDAGQTEVRKDLNRFIAEQDRYNFASAGEREVLRRSGTFSNTYGLNKNNVTLPGSPKPYVLEGSSPATKLTANYHQFALTYDVSAPEAYSGFTVSFDNLDTPLTESQDISMMPSLIFGVKGPLPFLELEITDAAGAKDTVTLTNVSSKAERFYVIPLEAVSNAVDKTRITAFHFVIRKTSLPSTALVKGTMFIRAGNPSIGRGPAPAKPQLEPDIPLVTNQNTVLLRGTKEAGTSILINGKEAIPYNHSTEWEAYVPLPKDGNHRLSVTVKNSIGKASSASVITVKKDTTPPTKGSIKINLGVKTTNTPNVTLKLSAWDSGSGIDKMSFSIDGRAWTPPESYQTAKAFRLLPWNGKQTVYVKFFDKMGNESAIYSSSIELKGGVLPVIEFTTPLPETPISANSFSVDYVFAGVLKEKTFTDLTEGQNTLILKEVDPGGAPVEKSFTVFVDTVKPSGSILLKDDLSSTKDPKVRLILNAFDGGSGIEQVNYSADGGWTWSGWESFSDQKEITLSGEDGERSIFYKIRDKAGNEFTVSTSVILDTRAPEGDIRVVSEMNPSSGDFFTITRGALESAYSYGHGTQDWAAEAYEILEDGSGYRSIGNNWKAFEVDARISENTYLEFEFKSSGRMPQIAGIGFSETPDLPAAQMFHLTGSEEWFSFRDHAYTASGEWQRFVIPVGRFYTGDFDYLGLVHDGDGGEYGDISFRNLRIYDSGEKTGSSQLSLALSGSDNFEVSGMRFSMDDGVSWSEWESFRPSKDLGTALKPGLNKILVELRDPADNRTVLTTLVTYEPVLEDGTQLFYEDGRLKREKTPGGSEIFFRADGSIEQYRFPDGKGFIYHENGSLEIVSPSGLTQETFHGADSVSLIDMVALRISDLVPPDFSMVLENGMTVYYRDGNPVEFKTQSGIRITEFTFDAENNLQNALLTYPDGTREILRSGKLLRRVQANLPAGASAQAGGTVTDYLPDGRIVREVFSDRTEFYAYEKDRRGAVTGMKIFSGQSGSVYDELGILREAYDEAKNVRYRYDRLQQGEKYKAVLNSGQSSISQEKIPLKIIYSGTGEAEEIILQGETKTDGTKDPDYKIRLAGGKVVSVSRIDGQGNESEEDGQAIYGYLENQWGGILGLNIRRDGAEFIYDETGFLKQIVTEQGKINRILKPQTHSGLLNSITANPLSPQNGLTEEQVVDILLETAGGDTLSDFELDEDGNIVRGIIETRDGIKQKIENGVLTGFETVDGKIYDFHDGEALLKEWKFRDGTRVIYSLGGGTEAGGVNISEILFPDGKRLHTIGFNAGREVEMFTETLPDGTQKVFADNRLVKLTTAEGAEIVYSKTGEAESVKLPDGSEQKVTYHKDAQGKVTEVIFEGDHDFRTFDPNGTVKSVLASGVQAKFSNSEILDLSTRFAEITAPTFDANGIFSGTVEYFDGSRQVIQAGKLMQTVRPDGITINYQDGLIQSIQSAADRYEILYEANNNLLENAKIRHIQAAGVKEFPLVPFLLNPGAYFKDEMEDPDAGQVYYYGGNASLVTDEKKIGTGSAAFDGFKDYLQVEANSSPDFQYGTEDFTIDLWFQMKETAGEQGQVLWSQSRGNGNNNHILLNITPADKLNFHSEKEGEMWAGIQSQIVLEAGRWYHTAVVRQGNTVKLYLDGNLQGTASVSGAAPGGTFLGMGLGSSFGPDGRSADWFNGYIDEVRVSKGIARWTQNFTPQETEYAKDAYTKLLLHFADPQTELSQQLVSKIQSILLSRPLEDAFGSHLQVASGVEDSGNVIYAARLIQDSDRGEVYQVNENYFPLLDENGRPQVSFENGYLGRSVTLDIHDNLPATVSELKDMNGDGLPDRVFVAYDRIPQDWWVALNYGSGFDAPIRWTGVETNFDRATTAYDANFAAIRYYEGRHPHVLADLIDVTGDGLPDRILKKGSETEHDFYIQKNNGHGFDTVTLWSDDVHPGSQLSAQGTFTFRTRAEEGIQELIADLIDMDGDGYPDRVIRPKVEPYTQWFFQRNQEDNGFEDAVLWGGVESGVQFNSTAAYAGSLSWDEEVGAYMGTMTLMADMNRDLKPDRILVDQSGDWHIQWNNGSGFDSAVLWDSDVRVFGGASTPRTGSAVHVIRDYDGARDILADLRDVTGDGLPDRITVDAGGAQNTWWVEVNTGTTFAPAVAWEGIHGVTGGQTAISQDNDNFRSGAGRGRRPASVARISDLIDMNGDGIADRVIFENSSNRWVIQYGTGSGFLPIQEMKIDSLSASAESVKSSRYDYLHVSLRADQNLPSSAGSAKIVLTDGTGVIQEWTLSNLTPDWKDFYLPIDKTKANAAEVRISFEPVSGTVAGTVPASPAGGPEGGLSPLLYVDNVTFTAVKPPAAKDWLDRMLAEENVLGEIYSDRNQTLAQYLGYVTTDAGTVPASPAGGPEGGLSPLWDQLLQAETRITFDENDQAESFETAYGAISKIENGAVRETVTPDGTKITFEAPSPASPQSTSQTVTRGDGSTEDLSLSYGRVREVARPGKSPLQYSYEFSPAPGSAQDESAALYGGFPVGTEITVVYDPDSGVTERYADGKLISRLQKNGIELRYVYKDGNLVQSSVVYQGRVRETFMHSENDAGNQVITTDTGIREEYDGDGKILSHVTPEGYEYQHSFSKAKKITTAVRHETTVLADGSLLELDIPYVTLEDDPEGEEVHQVTLSGYESAEGDAYADYENGKPKTLLLRTPGDEAAQPGTWTRFEFSRTGTEEKVDPETGETEKKLVLLDVDVFHPDGSVTRYRDGKPFAIVSASGKTISLETGVNPNESAVFHRNEAQKFLQETVLPAWKKYTVPESMPIQMEYDTEGDMVTRTLAGGTVELYTDGKVDEILSSEGERLIDYTYDEDGNPVKILMEGSRRRLESTVLKLKAEIALEREKALARVAVREAVLNQTIEGEYIVIRDRLLIIRNQIEEQKNHVASIPAKGKLAKNLIGDAMAKIQVSLDQVNGALAKLAEQRSESLEKLALQVREISNQIEEETEKNYAEIETQNQVIRAQILKQEISPVVYHWYRKILGRDPSKSEYEAVVAGADYETAGLPLPDRQAGAGGTEAGFDLESLKNQLLSSPEFAVRQAEVSAIKARVENELLNFLLMTASEKAEYARDLGIDGNFLVDLTSGEAEAILGWLNRQSLHFGQSAFIALEALLDGAGIAHSRVELAADLILMDILTGTITPAEEGDLVISLYAMRRFAEIRGLESAANFELDYGALQEIFRQHCQNGDGAEGCDFQVVAHINGNHFVILTNITAEEVTYIDPGIGPEGTPEIIKISKADFLEAWVNPALTKTLCRESGASSCASGVGYVLMPRAPPAELNLILGPDGPAFKVRELSSGEAMRVRGAFFPFLIPIIIAIVQAIVGVITAAVTAIVSLVSAVVSGIGGLLSSFGSFLSGFFTGPFLSGIQGLYAGFKTAFLTLHGLVMGGIEGLAGAVPIFGSQLSGLVTTGVFKGFVGGLMFGYGLGGVASLAEKIGISPKFINSVISGGKIVAGIAMLATGNPMGISFIAGGTSDLLSLHTNMSPALSSVIGISAAALGAFAGGVGGIGGGAGGLNAGLAGLKSALPVLSKEFASAGLTAVGGSLGWDPRLVNLLDIGVRAAATGIGNHFAGPGESVGGYRSDGTQIIVSNPSDLGDFIGGAIQNGAKEISFDVGSFGGSSGGGFTDGGFTPIDIDGSVVNQPGLFDKIFSSLKDAAISAKNFLGPVAIAATPSIIASFNQAQLNNGLSQTLNENVNVVFDRPTIENIFQTQGGIDAILAQGTTPVTLPDQTIVNGYKFSDTTTLLFDQNNEFIGQLRNGRYEIGEFSVTGDQEFALQDGVILEDVGNGNTLRIEVADGKIGEVIVQDATTTPVVRIEGDTEPIFIKGPDKEVSFGNNFRIEFGPVQIGFELGKLKNVKINSSSQTPADSSSINDELYVLVNGIRNDELGEPGYLANLKTDLVEASNGQIGTEDVITAPTFLPLILSRLLPQLGFGANLVKDLILWAMETNNPLKRSLLSAEIIANIESYYALNGQEHRDRSIVGVGYSGGFAPLMETMIGQGYNATSLVALGAALNAKQMTEKVLDKILQAVDVMKNFQAGQVDFLKGVLNEVKTASSAITGLTADVINDIATFVQSNLIENAMDLFKSKVESVFQAIPSFALGSLIGTSVDFVVNVWGSNDILEFFGIGGYQQDIGGKTGADLFNIKIMGAEHDDYMRRPDGDTWNLAVSDFVTRLVVNSSEKDRLNQFFLENAAVVSFDTLTNTWVVKLPGWENYV